ncbi:MAG TPA: biopolymer transporter ExbD, partial [bacterium]|nr:biopolymer transporter ExbD [bacterium]
MRIEPLLPRKRARLEIIPLIDIMFFLLATFIMVSLSMIQNRGLVVALPAASAAVAQAAPSVVLGLTAQGALYWDKQPIGAADLP